MSGLSAEHLWRSTIARPDQDAQKVDSGAGRPRKKISRPALGLVDSQLSATGSCDSPGLSAWRPGSVAGPTQVFRPSPREPRFLFPVPVRSVAVRPLGLALGFPSAEFEPNAGETWEEDDESPGRGLCFPAWGSESHRGVLSDSRILCNIIQHPIEREE
jgi:hypothetical protein